MIPPFPMPISAPRKGIQIMGVAKKEILTTDFTISPKSLNLVPIVPNIRLKQYPFNIIINNPNMLRNAYGKCVVLV